MEGMEPLLTADEVAAWHAVSGSAVRHLVRRGRLPHLRIGGQHRFRP